MITVLAIDDEPAIRRLLQAVLGRGGFQTIAAADAQSGLQALGRGGVDAIVLDLGLPDRDGLEVISSIRAVTGAPIVVLTARSEVSEKICALDLGADDYVMKPFDGDELLARLRSALRRASPAALLDRLAHGSVEINLAQHQVTVSGRAVSLTPREFEVLSALTEAGGRILTHSTLLERVWGKAHRGDVEYLRVVIRALRLKIETDPSVPQFIKNEPGIGYRLDEVAGQP